MCAHITFHMSSPVSLFGSTIVNIMFLLVVPALSNMKGANENTKGFICTVAIWLQSSIRLLPSCQIRILLLAVCAMLRSCLSLLHVLDYLLIPAVCDVFGASYCQREQVSLPTALSCGGISHGAPTCFPVPGSVDCRVSGTQQPTSSYGWSFSHLSTTRGTGQAVDSPFPLVSSYIALQHS